MTIFEDYFSSLYQQTMESNNFEKCFDLEESKEKLRAAFDAGVESSAKMTDMQKRIAAEMLELASEQFSNNGCNDYPIEATPENIEFVRQMNEEDDDLEGEDKEPFVQKGKLYLCDFAVMQYCAKLLRK